MISIPSHIERLQPYKPGKASDPEFFSRYKAILCSNENNFGPSPLAIQAIKDYSNKVHLYPDPAGEKLIEKLSIRHNRSQEEFILSNGLDGFLYTIFKAFTEPGEHVLTNDNSFIAFKKFGQMNNVRVETVPTIDYKYDLDSMLGRITPDTKLIYLCNPNNPTGLALTSSELAQFIESVPEQILIIIDEAYFAFARKIDASFPNSAEYNRPNVLTLRTFSKLYGLAGLRIGYAIGHPYIIHALKKVKLVFNPNCLAQVAAHAALDDVAHVEKTVNNNHKWMKCIPAKLKEKGIRSLESYANFICTIFNHADEAAAFHNYMDENGVLLRKLDGFDIPEGVRISIGNNSEMEYFCEVLERYQ